MHARSFLTLLSTALLTTSLSALEVTNTNDSGAGSLRQAILDANAATGSTTITFAIPQTDLNFIGGIYIIRPLSALPPLTNGTKIDGSGLADTNTNGPEIVLDGVQLSNGPGLTINGIGCGIHHLAIGDFTGTAIVITSEQAVGNVVTGCYLGTGHDGASTTSGNLGGIVLSDGASGNRIGGPTEAERNVIAGNQGAGISLGNQCADNVIQGNYIGVNRLGTAALANGSGIEAQQGSSNNIFGGTGTLEGNVISGNTGHGIQLRDATQSTIIGNIIGLDVSGANAIPNGNDGILIDVHSHSTVIGGTAAGAGNVISGNTDSGIAVRSIANDCQIIHNIIGLNAAGDADRGNGIHGIFLAATLRPVIQGNVISGNGDHGISMAYAGAPTGGDGVPDQDGLIQGNIVGLDATGANAIGNGKSGLEIGLASHGNQVGGRTPAERNLFSGNGEFGILIHKSSAPGEDQPPRRNVIEGNWIGLPLVGTQSVGNGSADTDNPDAAGGIAILHGIDNVIGGTAAGAGNVISGNHFQGIFLHGTDTVLNRIEGNWIGLDTDGVTAKPNTRTNLLYFDGAGMNIWDGARDNIIGGTESGSANYISGNASSGITIQGPGTDRNRLYGNRIGVNVMGQAMGNGYQGISIYNGAKNTQIGGAIPGTSNTIAHNGLVGIGILQNGTTGHTIRGNAIYNNQANTNLASSATAIDLIEEDPQGAIVGEVTANDTTDADTGPNDLQNYPVIAAATVGAAGTLVGGTLQSLPDTLFRLEFFAGPATGRREGRHFIGSATEQSSAAGLITFSESFPVFVPTDWVVSATATHINTGNTSEFSAPSGVAMIDSDDDGMPNDYEQVNNLNAFVPNADGDADGDGLTNITEMNLGTDPQAYTDGAFFTMVPEGNDIRIDFPTTQGRTYRIEASSHPGGTWVPLIDQVQGTGNILTIVDRAALTLTRRFYRLAQFP